MGLNWIEDIVAQLYKLKGYMVLEDEIVLLPRNIKRAVQAPTDLDVVAINEKEVIHIECQTWWVPDKHQEVIMKQKLKEKYKISKKILFQRYKLLNKNKQIFRKIFVVGGKPKEGRKGPWSRLEKFCKRNKIELIDINDIIKEMIIILKEKYPKGKPIGKERGIVRFLMHLIQNNFIKEID